MLEQPWLFTGEEFDTRILFLVRDTKEKSTLQDAELRAYLKTDTIRVILNLFIIQEEFFVHDIIQINL